MTRKIRNVISGVITVLICDIIFTATDETILIALYSIGMLVISIVLFNSINKIIGVITNGKKN